MTATVHQIRLRPDGRLFAAAPDQSILVAGLAAGIRLPFGCRMGVCRSCIGRVSEGVVDLGRAHPHYLTAEDRAGGYALLCQARAMSDVTIEVEELPHLVAPKRFPAMVRSLDRLSDDVMRIMLRIPLHQNLTYVAGQFIELILEDGERRSYSMANPPQAEGQVDLEFHVRHLPGGRFTDHVFDGLRPRDKLMVEAPLGTFFLREGDRPIVLIASGTGYAPVRAMLLHALEAGDKRSMILYWGGRRRRDLYALDEILTLAAHWPNLTAVPVVSEEDWGGRGGLVTDAVAADLADLSGHDVYACGAPAMVEAARLDLSARCHLPSERFWTDSFVSRADAFILT